MGDDRNTMTSTFEKLFNKSVEANKVFMNEGSKIISQLAGNDNQLKNLNIFQNKIVKHALSEYVDLNVKHFKNLIDLGLNFVKDISKNDFNPSNDTDTDTEAPSFVLAKTIEAGSEARFKFLLDNVKPELVKCELVNTEFVNQSDNSACNFKTDFDPQFFELNKDEAKPVSICVEVPESISTGLYISNIQVKGFEPAYFSIELTITEKQKETISNAAKKATRKKGK